MSESGPAHPCVQASASVRCDLTGAYTDCPPAVDRATSHIVNIALDRRARARISAADHGRIHVTTTGRTATVPAHPTLTRVVTRIAEHFDIRGVSIDVTLPVPPGTGLGTSAAQGVAVAAACPRYAERDLTRDDLAELAASAERGADIPGGRQIARARGFHSADAALALVMLTHGPITHTLPHEKPNIRPG